jgi:hypothetical protein
MDFRFAVDPGTGWGKVTITCEVVVEDLRKLLAAAWSDPVYATIERALWNFEGAWTSMRMEDLMQLAPWISANKEDRSARTIAIVAPDDVVFGVGRMFNALQSAMSWTISVFRDEAAARACMARGQGADLAVPRVNPPGPPRSASAAAPA